MSYPASGSSRAVTALGLVCAIGWGVGDQRARAQDAQYWTLQYGNQARLLGGTVVGGSADLSSTYYNPGRLALLDKPELLLAGNVFEYTSVTVEGALGDQALESTRLGSVPSLFAGQLGKPVRGESRLAYSFLSRHHANLRIDERRDLTDIVDYDVDQVSAAFSLDQYLSEYWAGLTWARPLSEHVGIGVSGYVAVRSQRSRSLILGQAAIHDPENLAGVAVQRRDFDYNHWGLLAKVGIGADLGAWKLGLTATTPNLKVYGQGSVGFDETLVTQDLDGDGDQASQVISGFSEGLAVEYRSAPSVALGVSRCWQRTTIHGAAEWFASVAGYTVIDLAPVSSSDGEQVRDADVRDQRDGVFNFGVGLEHAFREDLRGFTSFRTDFTSSERAGANQLTTSIWDIYHLTAGATFRAFDADFTLGLMYAFGNAESEPEIGLIPDSEEEDVPTVDQTLEFRFRRFTGLIGFAFGF